MKQVEKRRMCPNCRAFITTDDKICPYCQVEVGPKAAVRLNPAGALGGLIPHARFTTMMILLINTGLYLATVVHSYQSGSGTGMDIDSATLFDFGAKYRAAIWAGQWWRLVTAGFLHGGLIHILMNSWVLFDLGAQVEEHYGTARYIVLYFVSTVTGFLASSYWSPALSIGASAGILGLIGAMIAVGVRDRSSYGAAMRSVYMRWVFYIILIGLLPIFATDNAAHIGGLAGGFVIAYICGTPGYSAAKERIWQIAAGLALGITGLAFAQMFLWMTSQK
ncbi:MAG: rhomboid family intramembrane serine protease [Bryobacteraceae bacterium]|jgi:rhomboid protease GluP